MAGLNEPRYPFPKEILLIPLGIFIGLVAAAALLRAFPTLLLQIALDKRPELWGVAHPYIGNLIQSRRNSEGPDLRRADAGHLFHL